MSPTQPHDAHDYLLTQLRQEVANAPTRAVRDALRKVGRRVLRNYKAAFPHLHTCQI